MAEYTLAGLTIYELNDYPKWKGEGGVGTYNGDMSKITNILLALNGDKAEGELGEEGITFTPRASQVSLDALSSELDASAASLQSQVNDVKSDYLLASADISDLTGTIDGSAQITVGTITNDRLANSTITGGKIANTTITKDNIVANTITRNQLTTTLEDAITTANLANLAVTTAKIDGSAVTTEKIAEEAITVGKINDLSGLATALIQYLIPTGTILPYGGSTAPSGFLLCNGAEYEGVVYPDLSGVIGQTFGGTGSKFKVPDASGRCLIGVGAAFYTRGATGGAATVTLDVSMMPNHNHEIGRRTGAMTGTGSNIIGNYNLTPPANVSDVIKPTGGGQAHNNMSPYLVTNFIIKT